MVVRHLVTVQAERAATAQARVIANSTLRSSLLASDFEQPVDHRTLTRRYTEEAVRFIQANRARPFFLYLAHTMPHVPLFRSKEFAGVRGKLDVAATVKAATLLRARAIREFDELSYDVVHNQILIRDACGHSERSVFVSWLPENPSEGTPETWIRASLVVDR